MIVLLLLITGTAVAITRITTIAVTGITAIAIGSISTIWAAITPVWTITVGAVAVIVIIIIIPVVFAPHPFRWIHHVAHIERICARHSC